MKRATIVQLSMPSASFEISVQAKGVKFTAPINSGDFEQTHELHAMQLLLAFVEMKRRNGFIGEIYHYSSLMSFIAIWIYQLAKDLHIC